MAQVALIETKPSSTNFDKYFEFEFDRFALCSDSSVQKVPKQNAVLVNTDTKVSLDGSDIDRIVLWKNHRQTSGNMAFNTYNKDVNTRPTTGLMYPRVRTRRRG